MKSVNYWRFIMKKSLEFQIAEIKNKIAALGYITPGSISEQYNVCGSPNCKCKDEKNPQKHGPYYYLSFTFKGKSHTEFISSDEIKKYREYIKNYKTFKELSQELIEKNLELLKSEKKIKK